jgi:hypothetical protein
MKLTFIFSNEPGLFRVSKYDIYKTYFELPNEALELPDCEGRLLTIVQGVARLTHAHLHVSCKDIGWKNKLIDLAAIDDGSTYPRLSSKIAAIGFVRYESLSSRSRIIKILNPVNSPMDRRYIPRTRRGRSTLKRLLFPLERYDLHMTEYGKIIADIRDTVLLLAATEKDKSIDFGKDVVWEFNGIHPLWRDNQLIDLRNKRRRNREREAKKQAAAEAKGKIIRKGKI